MSPSEAVALAAADLDHVAGRIDRALAQLAAAQPGIRSVPTDSAGSSHGGDPTPAAALAHRHDPAARALVDLADALIGTRQRTAFAVGHIRGTAAVTTPAPGSALPVHLAHARHDLDRIRVSLGFPARLATITPEGARETREALLSLPGWTRSARAIVDAWAARPTSAGAGHGDAGCQWMSRHNGPWEEARYSVDGPQGQRLRVGQRTWRWLRQTGELPGRDVVRAWAQGRQPRRTVDPKKGTAA